MEKVTLAAVKRNNAVNTRDLVAFLPIQGEKSIIATGIIERLEKTFQIKLTSEQWEKAQGQLVNATQQHEANKIACNITQTLLKNSKDEVR